MRIKEYLSSWKGLGGEDIAEQFKLAYVEDLSCLNLSDQHRHSSDYQSDQIQILEYIVNSHPSVIVRSKANIIVSRQRAEHPDKFDQNSWTIKALRGDLRESWIEIKRDISVRWALSIMECFGGHGTGNEKVISTGLSILCKLNVFGKQYKNNNSKLIITNDNLIYNPVIYRPDDTFANLMIVLNRSMTPELKPLVLFILDSMIYDEALNQGGMINCAKIWRIIVEEDVIYNDALPTLRQRYPDIDTNRNVSLSPQGPRDNWITQVKNLFRKTK